MKKNIKSMIAAVLCAAAVLASNAATVFAAETAPAQAPSDGGTQTTQIVIDGLLNEFGNDYETRPLEEGDQWAIDLIDATEKNGELAGGYDFLEYNLAEQGKLYMNGASKVVINACNYNEDMQALDIWADNACAMIKIKNITAACDTIFSEPKKTKVCGYDAIMYDVEIIQYKFIDNSTKEVYDTYKGRNYYFYSDKNAYAILFDTNDETWNSEVANFEAFMESLVVDGISNEKTVSPVVIIVICAAVVAAGVITAVVIGKKKKKAE